MLVLINPTRKVNKMAEYIDKNAAITMADYAVDEHPYEKREGRPETYSKYNQGWNDACDYIRDMLEDMPAADVAPVRHGKWIYESHKRLGEEPRKYNAWYVSIICADCQYEDDARWIVLYEACYPGLTDDKAKELVLAEAKAYNSFRFCPHCGAKMDLED